MGYLTHFVTALKSKIWTRRMLDYFCINAGHEAFESMCYVCNAYQGFTHFFPSLSQESASSSHYSVNLF